jgi:hypothetical protein
MTTRWTFNSVSRKLLRCMSRSIYIRARMKHSLEHDAYLWMLGGGWGRWMKV